LPTSHRYTFFSAAHRTFSRLDHILGHKGGLNKHKIIAITSCILSEHNGITLKINNEKLQIIFKHMEAEQ
jgi:hypothetical protein